MVACGSRTERDGERYFGAVSRSRANRDVRSDEHRALPHAADAMRRREIAGCEAATIVTDGQHGVRLQTLETELDVLGAGVSGNVGEGLLGNAINDEFLLLRQRKPRVEMSADVELRLLGDPSGQRAERALETEVLKRLRSQPTGDPANVLGASAGRFAQLFQLLPEVVGDRCRQALDLKHDSGEGLADLVVQLARNPASLGLLHHEGAIHAVASFRLESVEHVIERAGQRGNVRIAADTRARLGTAGRGGAWSQRARRAGGTPAAAAGG
jgi:hypothetical protein